MKIQINKAKPLLPEYLESTYTLEMTGEELVRFWALSYDKEAGDEYPTYERFNQEIVKILKPIMDAGEYDFFRNVWKKHFRKGKYVE